MSSHFTSFAVAGGSGNTGRHIVSGLLSAHAGRVVVLSRSADTKVPAEAEVVTVDYNSPSSIESALTGVGVLISCLRLGQDTIEPLLARAAHKAGVQLFLPSHWGSDSDLLPPGSPLYHKRSIGMLCKEIGLAELRVNVGVFPDTAFAPRRFGIDFTRGKVEIVGDGNAPYSFTTEHSVGEYVGKLLTTLRSDELKAQGSVNIEGDRLTLNQVLALFRAIHPNRPLQVSYTSPPDSAKFASTLQGYSAFGRWGANMWAQGGADITRGGKVELDKGLVEGWVPEKVKDWLRGMEFGESVGGWAWYDEREK